MMKTLFASEKLAVQGRRVHAAAIVGCCLLAGCQRAPQTAAELQKSLPHQYRGELHLQGEQQARQVIVEPHDFTVLDAHSLEFNRVRCQLLAGSEVSTDLDAQIRGTISAPGLVIHIEEVAGTGEVDGGDVLKAGTFYGTLSSDLHTLNATWKTGFGQGATLKVEAVP